MSPVPICIPVNDFFTPSKHQRLIRCDKPPFSKDDHWFHLCPPGPGVSISYLREAISSLDSKMAALLSQRHELESHLERAVRIQSPVLRLPSELLSSIFVIGVLGMGEEDPVMISTLMLVCRHWADVTLNTPALWARILISPHHTIKTARRRIERSKTFPLNITVSFGPRLDYATNVMEQIMHAMDLIRPVLSRTRHFHLSVPNRPQAYAALARCQENAPLLESLSIRIFHSMQDDTYYNATQPLFNGHTPRLHSCSLTSFNFGWDLRLVSRLRVLKLDGYFNSHTPSASTLLGIFRECPELEELALRNMSSVDSEACAPQFDDSDSPSKIHLHCLTQITFYYAGITLTRLIMNQIICPNLASLEMCYLENVTPILNSLHTQALTRLSLRHLRIETCLLNEAKFLSLLRRLGTLTSLELVDMEDISSNFLKSLSSSQPWICPQLNALVLDGCTTLDWDSLRTFVESRLPVNPYALRRYPANLGPFSSWSKLQALPQQQVHHAAAVIEPRGLDSIDVTRCTQISKEMVQWLRIYVANVKCESAKGVWAENLMP